MEGSRVFSDFRMGKIQSFETYGDRTVLVVGIDERGPCKRQERGGSEELWDRRERGRQGTQAMVKCCGPVLCVHGSHTRV